MPLRKQSAKVVMAKKMLKNFGNEFLEFIVKKPIFSLINGVLTLLCFLKTNMLLLANKLVKLTN
jgi:hypothetical protein